VSLRSFSVAAECILQSFRENLDYYVKISVEFDQSFNKFYAILSNFNCKGTSELGCKDIL